MEHNGFLFCKYQPREVLGQRFGGSSFVSSNSHSLKEIFFIIVPINFETAIEQLLPFKAYYIWGLCFFGKYQTDWLYTTISNRPREFR